MINQRVYSVALIALGYSAGCRRCSRALTLGTVPFPPPCLARLRLTAAEKPKPEAGRRFQREAV